MTPKSEAGQRLLAELNKGKSKAVDMQLRASYTPSRVGGTPGRVFSTPAGLKTPMTPAAQKGEKVKEKGKEKEGGRPAEPPKPTSLTDDLLNL